MDITITLSDDEVTALDSEKQNDESYEALLHRLISPLVARAVSTKFKQLMVRFQAAPVSQQARVLDVLEKMF